MRRPQPSYILCVFLLFAQTVRGQEHELETRPLAGLRADVAALILGARASGDLLAGPLEATASGSSAPRDESDGVGVEFRLEVAGPSLLEGAPEESADDLRLELLAYVITRSGELEISLAYRIDVPSDEFDDLLLGGGIRLTGHLEVPAGEYQLRVLVREPRSQRFALRLENVVVPGAEIPTETPTENQGAVAEPVAESPAFVAIIAPDIELSAESVADEDFLGERTVRRVAAIAAGYREVLGRLAAGRTADAVAGLRRLESEALELDPNRLQVSEWLTAGQDRVVDKIAERSPEALLPILLLHTEIHTVYLENDGDPFLIDLARKRILDVAQRFALGGNELAVTLAASVLAEVGVTLDQTARIKSPRLMFEAALDLDDTNPVALLNLAYWYERHGEYRRAVQLLRRFLDVVPRSFEGSLRLALSLGRLGEQQDEEEEILRRLIRDSPAEWLLAVAYQELAVLLVAGDRLDEARQLLENGISRLPRQQRLYIQLAYVLERSGRAREGHGVVDRFPADDGKVSPRHLYIHRPPTREPGAGESVSETLLRQATARLPVLAAELAQWERK